MIGMRPAFGAAPNDAPDAPCGRFGRHQDKRTGMTFKNPIARYGVAAGQACDAPAKHEGSFFDE